jgi:hypothetical protein
LFEDEKPRYTGQDWVILLIALHPEAGLIPPPCVRSVQSCSLSRDDIRS